MDAAYQKLLADLAARLGITVEHLWAVLLNQAPITGTVKLCADLAIIALAASLFKLVSRKTTVPPRSQANQYPSAAWENEAAMFAWLLTIILFTSGIAYLALDATDIAAAFFNPEYWALSQVLSMLKK